MKYKRHISPFRAKCFCPFRYTDLVGEFSAALYGHSNPVIIAALTNVLQNVGINLGATTSQENMFARELCQRFNLERVRYTNSGTEGCLHALAAARLFTGKRRVVAFGGGYHGAVLDFTKGEPGANTVDIDDWIVAKYNDLTSATEAIQSENVAAVLVEGLQSAGGCINGTKEFLMGVQDAASKVSEGDTGVSTHMFHGADLDIGRGRLYLGRGHDFQTIR